MFFSVINRMIHSISVCCAVCTIYLLKLYHNIFVINNTLSNWMKWISLCPDQTTQWSCIQKLYWVIIKVLINLTCTVTIKLNRRNILFNNYKNMISRVPRYCTVFCVGPYLLEPHNLNTPNHNRDNNDNNKKMMVMMMSMIRWRHH